MKISFLSTVMISLGLPRCLLTTSLMLYEILLKTGSLDNAI